MDFFYWGAIRGFYEREREREKEREKEREREHNRTQHMLRIERKRKNVCMKNA